MAMLNIIDKLQKLDSNLDWYRATYNNLITTRLNRGLDKSKLEGYYEKHHIVPKCLGGPDEESNYVLLTAKEHILAHMILARIYYDNFDVIYSCKSLTMSSKFTIDRFKDDEKAHRSALGFLAYTRELYSEHRHRTEISKEQKEKIFKANKGKPSPTTWGNKISDAKKGKPYGTPVKDPNGVIFKTLANCSKIYKVTPEAVKYWAKKLSNIRGFYLVDYKEQLKLFTESNGIIDSDGNLYPNIDTCASINNLDIDYIQKVLENNLNNEFRYLS